ncbi:hypothetical protein [Sinosporangium siamense]|nr:hypothetical protein [Sinosporangium siamense]
MPVWRLGAVPSLGARRVPVTALMPELSAHRLKRALAVGGLLVAGWLLALVFGASGAAHAAADAGGLPSFHTQTSDRLTGSLGDGFPPVSDDNAEAPDNAEAMAGRHVDGLTGQSRPGFPAPSSAEFGVGLNGVVPQAGGGHGPFGPGDLARSDIDPRVTAQRRPPVCACSPVVRTAADEPSFSPD